MDISLAELKEKEIINILDGKKLGRIIDVLFDIETGVIKGIVVPGERKIFKKSEDIFISLEKLKKIGDDVVLVKIPLENNSVWGSQNTLSRENQRYNFSNYYPQNLKYSGKYYSNNDRNGFKKEQNKSINNYKGQSQSNYKTFVRFKPINNIKYK